MYADEHEAGNIIVAGDYVIVVEAHTPTGAAVIMRFAPNNMPPWRRNGLLAWAQDDWGVEVEDEK